MRVLVVDDDQVFRTELASILEDEGHAAVAVESADAALSALEARWFDVALTDLRMPRKSGTLFLDEATRRWPALRSIIVTGQPTDEAIASSLVHGAFNFIGKPVRVEEVLQVLALVEADITFARMLAPEWDPRRLADALGGRDPGSCVGWGPPLAGVPPWAALPLDGATTAGPSRSPPRPSLPPSTNAVILHFGWQPGLSTPAADLTELAWNGEATAGPGTPLVLVADERLVDLPTLLAFWQVLHRERVPAGLAAVAGPQRREVVRRLKGREIDPGELARGFSDPTRASRARFCLEHLAISGLAEQRLGRYRLTATGENVAELLERVDSSRGALPARRHLFGERA